MIARSLIHTCIFVAAGGLMAQSTPVRPAFEVASVKRNTTNGTWDQIPRISGDRVTMHNTQLGNIVFYAYGIRRVYEMAGNLDLPAGWNWFDIEAKVEGTPTDDELRLMFQNLLEDRFKLKVHRETREMAVYDLVVAKGGPKLTAADEHSKLTIDGRPIGKGANGIFLGVDGAHLMGKGATFTQLVDSLRSAMRGPVEDHTGIQGAFDKGEQAARHRPGASFGAAGGTRPEAGEGQRTGGSPGDRSRREAQRELRKATRAFPIAR
jgi:uncharacterized protein (TIGR03435 family)